MEIYPIRNIIVQWKKSSPIFLNVFDTPQPHFFYLTQYSGNEKPVPVTITSYEIYIKNINVSNVPICVPTAATTREEALFLHPELFI